MTKQAFHSLYGKDHLISSSIQLVLDEGESSQQKLPSSSNSKCNNFVFESTKNPTLEKEAQSILSFNNGADNRLQSYNGNAVLNDDGFATWDGVTDHDGFTIHLSQEANSFKMLKNNIKCQFGDSNAKEEDLQASKRHCLGKSGQPKVRKPMQTKDPQIVDLVTMSFFNYKSSQCAHKDDNIDFQKISKEMPNGGFGVWVGSKKK
ncbi:hypothetical protein QJS10_CPA01g01357 [Acorus calamus]|uniref:Uncharacterized protein n=1 Tax=Acorus calamus TaxID=4465 RepID=A0AAV9FHS9_ACOCL|nr:hypothetical protein QJS10_CPA01g01357 [Acorus calamus]